jgi:RNA polymerase sigma-70 factor (ECF subfamily)
MSITLLNFDRFGKPEDELAIIERAKGNPEYFAPLYKKYHEAIFRYVAKRVDEEEAAYDITSCVFIKALINLPKYEYRGIPFSSWLFRIAKSELYQSFRDKKAQRTVSLDSVTIVQFIDELNEDFSEEQRKTLLNSLKLLKDHQLQLIEMRFFEKRSFKEIGEIVGLTENNAKVKTFRVLVKLKEIFNRTKA